MDYDKIEQMIKDAKKIIMEKKNFSVDLKGLSDFVTEIDVAVSLYVKEQLAELSPGSGFFSEEESGGRLSNDCWILDPIDGTTNLVYGLNKSCISLGHFYHGEIVYGIVYDPFAEETFTAERGKGAFLNHSKRIKVSSRPMSEALIDIGAGSARKNEADVNFKIGCELFKQCVDIRRIGSSALILCYIADGRLDGYFQHVLKPWDYAAGSLILSEAGGKLTDFNGEPVGFTRPSSIIAGNGIINDVMIATVRKYIVL